MLSVLISQIEAKIKELGLSYSAVEKRLGFGNGAIKRFSSSAPSIEKVMLLANFLNVSLDWLVYGTNSFNDLTENETEFLTLIRSLKSETDQGKLIGFLEGYAKTLPSYSENEYDLKQEASNE
ncbi:MAG: helix-turn-helix transcriptional regulator [Clostridia bacterium]|nr:helix-turn-helix transcriptional regulator [Clostridia bacterium]